MVKSKEAYDDRELAIVALLPGDPHAVVTFGVPLSYYGAEPADRPADERGLLRGHQFPLGLQPAFIPEGQGRHLIGQLELKQLATLRKGITELKQMLLNQTAGSGDGQTSYPNKDGYDFGTTSRLF